MRHESKFAAWIRSGGKSVFVLPLGPVRAPEVKFSVVPDRLLDSIIDDPLATAVARLNGFPSLMASPPPPASPRRWQAPATARQRPGPMPIREINPPT